MTKITRKKLARGTKLFTDQTHEALRQEALKLSSATVLSDQFEAQYGTFRVNINLPYLNSSFVSQGYSLGSASDPGYPRRPFGVPITFPPFQELTSVTAPTLRVTNGTYSLIPDAPRYYLDEISFSFDTRGEGATIADRWNNASDTETLSEDVGKIYWGSQDPSKPAYDLRLSIVEKPQTFFDQNESIPSSTSPATDLGREVWSFEVSGIAFRNAIRRPNPLLIEDINVVLEAYRTYVFMIEADGLAEDQRSGGGGRMSFVMPNIMASMKFRSELRRRDVSTGTFPGSSSIQNIPEHEGELNTSTVSTSTPAAGATVTAEGTSGLATNMATLDEVFREGISGGYTEHGEMQAIARYAQDSCYDVIAVPLMQNRRQMIIKSGSEVLNEPYIDAAGAGVFGTQILADRRIIPITDPMVIHHVILGWNWQVCTQSNQGTGAATLFQIPASAGFTVDVGVGVGTGLQSDSFYYDQVASHSMVAPNYVANGGSTTWYSKVIDRIATTDKAELAMHPSIITGGNTLPWWDLELHQVPIVGSGGAGYYSQGKPVFVGKTRDNTSTRSNLGGSAAAGTENFLEVRMTIKDTAAHLNTSPTSGEYIYSGYQGHFIYLLCKKSMK